MCKCRLWYREEKTEKSTRRQYQWEMKAWLKILAASEINQWSNLRNERKKSLRKNQKQAEKVAVAMQSAEMAWLATAGWEKEMKYWVNEINAEKCAK